MIKTMTCIECPIGCEIEVEMDGNTISSIKGYTCPRGKQYAENEVTYPKRVITSTIRAQNGVMVPVKTDKPVRKSEMFAVMEKINKTVCVLPVKIGDIVVENICDDAHLVVAGNIE